LNEEEFSQLRVHDFVIGNERNLYYYTGKKVILYIIKINPLNRTLSGKIMNPEEHEVCNRDNVRVGNIFTDLNFEYFDKMELSSETIEEYKVKLFMGKL
jgi:hypothetical protein